MNGRAQFSTYFLNQLSQQLQPMGYPLGGTFCSSSKQSIKYISALVLALVWIRSFIKGDF